MAPTRLARTRLGAAGLTLVAFVWGVAAAPAGDDSSGRTSGAEAAAAPAPILEILPPNQAASRRLRIETLVTSSEIRRVEFRLNGRVIDHDRRFPFAAGIDPALCQNGGRLEAIGFDRRGVELARDEVVLESSRSEFSIRFGEVRPFGEPGWLEVQAEVELPGGASLERIDFYRGDRYAGSVSRYPFRMRLPRCDRAPFLRAVAHSSDGRSTEGVHVLGGGAANLSVSLVEIYAMVTDRSGRPVSGLEPGAFELRHAGVTRPIERFSEGDAVPLSLALVIDSSGSMLASMQRAKRAARRFLTQVLDPGDEVLLVDFDHRPRLLEAATSDIERLVTRFEEIESDGASAVYDGIAFALLQLERAPGRRALVVLTDGRDSGSLLTARRCARLARRSGVPIFVLRPVPVPDARPSHHALALEELADSTAGALYEIRSPDDVEAAYELIDRQLRGQYLIAFEADEVLSRDELETLVVRVSDDRLRVRTLLAGQVRLTD